METEQDLAVKGQVQEEVVEVEAVVVLAGAVVLAEVEWAEIVLGQGQADFAFVRAVEKKLFTKQEFRATL